MYQYRGIDDTIAAIATAVGQASIGVVRLSGTDAMSIAEKIFVSKNESKLSSAKNHTVHYGWIINPNSKENIDEVLVTVMRAPKTYTREDTIEISCHGGITAVQSILKLLLESGARLAEPGEFTKRAFLNGRIDLTQAEAVLDIINSRTDTFLRISNNQLRGELSKELESVREILINVYIEIEAILNFPEDDIDVQARGRLSERIQEARRRVENLLKSSDQGRILKDGIKLVLCGRPNVGKSSLLNVLLKTPRAIVSEIAGTTRDTIEEAAQIQGVPFQLVDTAGILTPRDIIEEEAIKRSHMSIQSADLVLYILDHSQPVTQEDKQLMEMIKGRPVIIVLNKVDLPAGIMEKEISETFPKQKLVKISALRNEGIEELKNLILKEVLHGEPVAASQILLSNVRHIESLRQCEETLKEAARNLLSKISLEFVSEEIKSAVNFLDAVTGRNIDEDLLENIFSQFCIGK
jgi:tRNA modification GTPase